MVFVFKIKSIISMQILRRRLTALPLGVYGSCGWLTVPLCAVTAFLLLGIDEIGVQIEE